MRSFRSLIGPGLGNWREMAARVVSRDAVHGENKRSP